MKKTLLFSSLFFLLISSADAQVQTCSLTISGGNCTGNELTANAGGDILGTLTWYQYTNNVFQADTVSSQKSISIVAGNHGMGSASNQFGFPAGGISVDPAGNVYVADAQNNRVQKWAPGAFTGVTVAGGHGAGSAANQLYRPKDVFADAGGNVYVADYGNNRIQKWAPGAASGVTVAGGNGAGSSPQQLNGPAAVYVDAAGKIYIADTYNYRIQKWPPGADHGVTVAGGNGYGLGANQFVNTIDVYLDAAKNIYVADANTEYAEDHRVQKWAPGAASGVTVAGGVGTNEFGYLLAIYVDADGILYTNDNGISGTPVSRVQKWLPGATGGITVAGGHASGWDALSYPTGIALDNNGLIYVLDGTYNPKVQKYIPTNGIADNTFAPSQPGPYTAQAVFKNGCIAASNSLIIRAIPETPQIYATTRGGRGNLCDGGLNTFFVNAWDDFTDYTWKIPGKCSLAANYNDSIVIDVPEGFTLGLLSAKGSNICGTSQPDTILLQGRPVMPWRIIGPRYVFANQAGITYSAEDISSNHNWIVPAGAVIQSGQGTSSISVNWGSAGGVVSVNAYNNCGASQRKEINVSLKSSAIQTKEQIKTGSLDVSDAMVLPNPSKGITTVRFNSVKQTNYTIELQDMAGRILMRKEILSKQGINMISVDVSKYPGGVYIINIKNADRKISLKLDKQ